MTQFHPDTQWLSEYSAGTVTEAQALCISTHLAFCTQCQKQTAAFTEIGAMIFNTQTCEDDPSPDVLPHALEDTLTLIQSRTAGAEISPHYTQKTDDADIPAAIKKLLPNGIDALRWKKLSPRISVAKLHSLGDNSNIALHKLQPGSSVSNHDHQGREITVVLRGRFSDKFGEYHPGDFLVREPGETHRPCTGQNEECLCLAVCEGPVRFTGFFSRLLNPLVTYQHKH